MRVVARTLVLLVVFARAGWFTERAAMRHEMRRGAVASQVRLGSATARLFAGGFATSMVGIAMVWPRGKSHDR
ncbi:MAG: hypothetical protein ACLGQX_11735 [Acidobacteriota bacterium]